ncbi:Methyltransferase domain-containing protein [Rhodococcus triatomae]|uniref:Methyltransferase domain-containing protein n=2 Tax=Rhodococcus triatomae TaxID=300028 RepID=A0A1G8LAA3_9NOCA|nr:Methyltransferase domain-containing protein [Rhodococcus triatomae]
MLWILDGMDHTHTTEVDAPASELWDAKYLERERIWSGAPNLVLVEETADLQPGTALELGAGEGADAIWLAKKGWQVTAVDVSAVALGRAAQHATDEGVADRIGWEQMDLAAEFPEGEFDLVSAHYFHSHGELPREQILGSAADAVAVGGVLLVVGHAGPPSWVTDHDHGDLPTPTEVYEGLRPRDGEWEILSCRELQVPMTAPDGSAGARSDNVLKIRRLVPAEQKRT